VRNRLALGAMMATAMSAGAGLFAKPAMVFVPRRQRNDPERQAAAEAKRARKNALRLITWTGVRS
jgi:hypothetical protein